MQSTKVFYFSVGNPDHTYAVKKIKLMCHWEKGGEIATMRSEKGGLPIKWVCMNCHKNIVGNQGSDGLTRIQCPYCGTVTVSKIISRRHVQVDLYAPQGQELLHQSN